VKQEKVNVKLAAKNIALIAVFAPWYTIFTLWPLFPVIGASGSFITMAVIMAPLIGIILGPYLGFLSVAVGGIIRLSLGQIGGPFGPLSFVPHAATTFCSGMLYNGKRMTCAVYFIWMQIIGLVILVSPLQSKAVEQTHEYTKSLGLTFGVGIISLTAALFGHIVGDIMFEAIYWPNLISNVDAWKNTWQLLAWVYPLERVIIAIAAALIGTALIKALKAYDLKL
jgi:biotin transporter BioY